MLLSIILIVLILAIAFFQTVQGMFSALLMALATLVCTLLSFSLYEPLAAKLAPHMPATALAVALVSLLAVSLLAVRILLDRFLGSNLVPGMWVDRVGGGLFGLFTALLLVGTLGLALQMLPFDRGIIGFDPYDDDLKPKDSLLIDAPAFTVGVVNLFAEGSLKPSTSDTPDAWSYRKLHDDLNLELWGTRNRVWDAYMGAPPDSLTIANCLDVTDQPYPKGGGTFGELAPAYAPQPRGSSRVYSIRVRVTGSVADKINKDGKDYFWWQLRGTQFRLVTADGTSFYPVAWLHPPRAGRSRTPKSPAASRSTRKRPVPISCRWT